MCGNHDEDSFESNEKQANWVGGLFIIGTLLALAIGFYQFMRPVPEVAMVTIPTMQPSNLRSAEDIRYELTVVTNNPYGGFTLYEGELDGGGGFVNDGGGHLPHKFSLKASNYWVEYWPVTGYVTPPDMEIVVSHDTGPSIIITGNYEAEETVASNAVTE